MSEYISRSRRTILALLFVTAAFVWATSVAGPPDAWAHWTRSNWAYKSSGCEKDKIADPVTVVFYGTAAHVSYLFADVKYHTGWDTRGGARQWIRDHGACDPMFDSLASGYGSRWHVRLWQKADRDHDGRWETVATPHHEDWVVFNPFNNDCKSPLGGNHAVDKGTAEEPTAQGSGFDQGRRKLSRYFTKTRYHGLGDQAYWGNTHSVKQCDRDWAGSNGWVNWISVGRT